jgi:hypothetical protein
VVEQGTHKPLVAGPTPVATTKLLSLSFFLANLILKVKKFKRAYLCRSKGCKTLASANELLNKAYIAPKLRASFIALTMEQGAGDEGCFIFTTAHSGCDALWF